jgi:hypothetical protein
MKFPSPFAEGMLPSGNSFALTYPGVFGSRVGSGGRAPLLAFAGACLSGGRRAGVWAIAGPKPAIKQIKNALVGTSNMQNSFPPILKLHIVKRTWANPRLRISPASHLSSSSAAHSGRRVILVLTVQPQCGRSRLS